MENSNVINVMTAINYIESNLSETLNLDRVAEAVHFSKYHLHRMFTSTVGMTIHDYVQRRQLTEAAKLLVFSEKPIIEIAFISGYESQQAFTTAFKTMYKQTPAEYRCNEEFYPLQLRFELKSNPTKVEKIKKDIVFATVEDIPEWLELVKLVIDGFPHLEEQEYIAKLEKYIHKRQALIMHDDDTLVGIMAFSYENGSIDFLGVHPQYRKHGITKAFLDKLMGELLVGREVSITTFREGDKADTGYRKEYQNLGFAESELLFEFGYPTQRLILSPEQEVSRNE